MGCSEKETVSSIQSGSNKCPTGTQIHSWPQAANETLQEYIQRLTNLVIHATGADPSSVTYQVTIILFIKHLFSKEIKKQVAGTKIIQTFRHARTPALETEIKLKKYKGLTDEDPSVIASQCHPTFRSVGCMRAK